MVALPGDSTTVPLLPETDGPSREAVEPMAGVSAVDTVDLLLWTVVRLAGTVTVVPSPGRSSHTIQCERTGLSLLVAVVPANFGDAIAARLAIVAGLSLGLSGPQFGRLRVRLCEPGIDASEAELLIAVRPTAAGLHAEIHQVASENPSAEDDAAPEILARGHGRVGMYQITGLLGQGGMGVVYRAEHIALQKPVALKVLRTGNTEDPRMAAQFLIEARAACRARHPGIIDVTDFGALRDGRYYLVMELVTWPTLARVLADAGGALPVARAVALLQRVASALEAAADQGVVHHDLTPSNIFVGPDDTTKIGDFGLARIIDRTSPTETLVEGVAGTIGYMSPEQWNADRSDTRSDIYALGVILYRMVTGRLPFVGATRQELLRQHLNDPVPTVTTADGPGDARLQHVIERAMAKRAAERYQSVREMVLALQDLGRMLRENSGWQRWTSRTI